MDAPLPTIEKVYEAFAARDLDALLALCAPDLVLTQDPALPWGGTYQGSGRGRRALHEPRGRHGLRGHARAALRGG